MVTLLVALALSASGQATGRPSQVNINGSTVQATGTTFARSLANRFADDVYVADFGVNATNDATKSATNDAGIALAIALAGTTSGKRLIFPAGYIQISATIDDTAGLSVIRGSGSAATYITWKSGVDGTGKAILRLRGRTTRLEGMTLNGPTSGTPDVGIDMYPSISNIAQMHEIRDVWVGTSQPPAVGLWSHDPPGGQQHEMIELAHTRVSGRDVGIKFDKIHEDLWTIRNCYIGHTGSTGASIEVEPTANGAGLLLEHTWLIGSNVGMRILSGDWDDMTWIASGSEGPATAVEVRGNPRWFVRGQGVGGQVHVVSPANLRIITQDSNWMATSTFAPFFVETSAQVNWTSSDDQLYLNGAKTYLQADIASFLAAVKTGGGSLSFALARHIMYGTVPHPLRIGGANGVPSYVGGTPMLEVKSNDSGSPSARFEASDGTVRFEVDQAGAFVSGVVTTAGSQTITGNLTVVGTISGANVAGSNTGDIIITKNDGSELDSTTVTNLAWPSTSPQYVIGGHWGTLGGTGSLTYTPNAAADPNGNLTAMEWALGGGTTMSHGIGVPAGTLSGDYNWSVYAQAGTYQYLTLDFYENANLGATFDVSGCATTYQTGGVTTAVSNAGGGWCRCSIYKNLSSSTYSPRVYVPQTSAGEVPTWLAAGTETIYVWGPQLTASTNALVYIPTITGAVSRKVYRLP